MTDRTDNDNDALPRPDAVVFGADGSKSYGYTAATVRRLLAEARAQEREACAKLCDPEPVDPWDSYTARNNKATMRLLAQRIRARGDTAPDPRDERIARLTEALAALERTAGQPAAYDDPVRVNARAALEDTHGR